MKNQVRKNEKSAFTLAELLIAIGIVGVVAALTIPTLVKNYQQKQTVEQLKKTYTVLTQAVRSAQAEEGDMSDWNFALSYSDFLDKYFAPYIKLSKVSKTYATTTLNPDQGTTYRTPTHAMSNGVLLLYTSWSLGRLILVDLNGYSGPNKVGRDIFAFQLFDNQIYPYNQYSQNLKILCNTWTGSYKYSGGTSGQCNKTAKGGWFGAGSSCSTTIFCNNWTIPKGYPW